MIDWNVIDTVLLDMDGTLLDLHFDNYFWSIYLPKRYAEVHEVALEEAHLKLSRDIERHRGSLQWYCLDHWSALLDMDILQLKEEIKHKIQVRPYTHAFLSSLGEMGKKRILATNAHRTGLRLKLAVTGINEQLDDIISSHDYNLAKEHSAFWPMLAASIDFDPTRTLFIDDTVTILERASEFGIAHLVCMNQPDSQQPPKRSNKFMDICHFDEIMPLKDQPS